MTNPSNADNERNGINQCDGCRRGLPLDERGNHYNPDGSYDLIGCTADRYSSHEEEKV
jgi:hypothetical protein